MGLEKYIGKDALVFGSGISGIGSAMLLEKQGVLPVIFDGNKKLTPQDVLAKLPAGTKARVEIGTLSDEVLDETALAVLSPGVPTDIPDVLRIREKNIPIWGEIELAYQCSRGDVLAITGTNGKTTTTTLVGEILKYHVEVCRKTEDRSETKAGMARYPWNDASFVVGNIGTPYTEAALLTTDRTVTVAEISSFQLETTCDFHPRVSAITNITPDHLDRHHTMEEYIRVKERITERQNAQDTVVLNYEDEILRAFGLELIKRRDSLLSGVVQSQEELASRRSSVKTCSTGDTLESSDKGDGFTGKSGAETAADRRLADQAGIPRVIFFSSARELEEGIYVYDDAIRIRLDGAEEKVLALQELKLPGTHNYENVMTAVAMTYAYGIPLEEIRHVVRLFTAVEHRIEYVAERKGVIYYNDSKGTNPDAAIKAVLAMDRPTVLLAGGYDKGASYKEWIATFPGRVKKLVLVGATKEKIAQEASALGFTDYVFAETFKEAFDSCVEAAEKGDAVLLSPACASWGMFPNYEVRGRKFKEYVMALEG